MKMLGTRFMAINFILGCLLFLYNPVSLLASGFPNDTNAHYGKDGSTCSEHMDNLQLPPQPNFVLCRANSGATTWYAAVYKKDATTPTCVFGSSGNVQTVPADGVQTFPCPITISGVYRAYVYWYVGGSSTMMSTSDYWFRQP